VHWWPLMDESGIWVLCPLVPSIYKARHTSDWAVAVTTEWHTRLLEDVVVRTNSMNLMFLEKVDRSSGQPLKLCNHL
jgi:hypothetical protein